jgi:hypothetical protein
LIEEDLHGLVEPRHPELAVEGGNGAAGEHAKDHSRQNEGRQRPNEQATSGTPTARRRETTHGGGIGAYAQAGRAFFIERR